MEENQSQFPFPPATLVGTTQTLSGFHRFTVDPVGEPALSYSLTLPEGWRSESVTLEKPTYSGQLICLGRFMEPNAALCCTVQVSYAAISFDLHLVDWLRLTAVVHKIEPLQWQVHTGPAGREIVELLGQLGPAERRLVVRLRCHADGARIFLIMVTCPVARYTEMATSAATVIGGFALLRPVNPGQLEPWTSAVASGPDFRIVHPVSWRPRTRPSPVAGKSIVEVLLAREQNLLGYVRVKGIDPKVVAETLEQTFQIAAQELTESGVVLKSPWHSDPDPLVKTVRGLVLAHRAHAQLGNTAVELRCIVANRDGLNFCSTVLSPPPDQFPGDWMRVNFAFLLASASAAGAAPPLSNPVSSAPGEPPRKPSPFWTGSNQDLGSI